MARRVGVRGRRSCVGDRRHGRKCRGRTPLHGSDDHRLQDRPFARLDAERAACGGHSSQKQSGGHHQLRSLRARPAVARLRRPQDRGAEDRRENLRRGNAVRDARRRGAQTERPRPDDLFGRTSDVHRRRLRRAGVGCRRRYDRHLPRKRLFQSRVGAQDRQAARTEYRFVVAVRARRRPAFAGLCPQTRCVALQGAGRRPDFERHRRGECWANPPISSSTSRPRVRMP